MAAISIEDLGVALAAAHPELDAAREAAGGDDVYLVGGAVRDLLLGRGRADIDLVVVGDAAALAARLGAEPREHERFATAKAQLDGHEVDIATARTETYAEPGALPTVTAAANIEEDLGRRDFTVNAMALPLGDDTELVDPFGGRGDLEAGLLRVLHERSFVDDPTRALRAARYAARLGFRLEQGTEELLRGADLDTVSADRRRAELLRLAAEATAPRGFELLAEWGLVEIRDGGPELAATAIELLDSPTWRGQAPADRTVLAAALGPIGGAEDLARAHPGRPSEAVELAARRDAVELVLARALGAEWLDRYVLQWRAVRLQIDGDDLIAAGAARGPAIGRGLRAALALKLDGELGDREEELQAALAAARTEETDGVA